MLRQWTAQTARRFRPPYPAIARQAAHYRTRQWETPQLLAAKQEEAWRELLQHCWEKVPYYRTALESIDVDGPGTVALAQLPILTKSLIRTNFEQLTSADITDRRSYINRSGGSTGEPVKLLQDRDYMVRSEARKCLAFEWAGLRPGARLIRLWGSEDDIIRGGIGARAAFKAFLNNTITLNAFRMTPDDMKRHLDIINRQGPAVIHAYAHAAYELARFAEAEAIRIKPQISVVSTSGTLHPFIADTISRVFGCKVFNQYGSREVSCIAADCSEHQGLHVCMETMIVEVLDDAEQPCAPGVEGDVVVTSLCNLAMPLIRYRIGDRATIATTSCPCGRGHMTLASVGGRIMDTFRRRDGTVVPAEYFIHFLGVVLNRGWVRKTQLVQRGFDDVELKLVTDGAEDPGGMLPELIAAIKSVMGPFCSIKITFHEDIPPSKSGKYRYTICELEPSDI
jgi:phenylacetate-CoA ligase